MRAILRRKWGDPERLNYRRRTEPSARGRRGGIRMRAASGVNFADPLQIAGNRIGVAVISGAEATDMVKRLDAYIATSPRWAVGQSAALPARGVPGG